MRILASVLEVYHSTSKKFTSFLKRPAWFALNVKDAKGWHKGGTGQSTTYKCKYTGGRIASVEQTRKLAAKVWPDTDLIYSMFDTNIGEFPVSEINKFINLLKSKGFDASYIEDYDPNDFEGGNSTSLCVFDPSKDVTIVAEYHIP